MIAIPLPLWSKENLIHQIPKSSISPDLQKQSLAVYLLSPARAGESAALYRTF